MGSYTPCDPEWHDGQRQLTPPDTVCHPPPTAEWLASKCVPSSGVVES